MSKKYLILVLAVVCSLATVGVFYAANGGMWGDVQEEEKTSEASDTSKASTSKDSKTVKEGDSKKADEEDSEGGFFSKLKSGIKKVADKGLTGALADEVAKVAIKPISKAQHKLDGIHGNLEKLHKLNEKIMSDIQIFREFLGKVKGKIADTLKVDPAEYEYIEEDETEEGD